MRRSIVVIALVLFLAIALSGANPAGALQTISPATLASGAERALQASHPVHLRGVAPLNTSVRLFMKGPTDAEFAYRGMPNMGHSNNWTYDDVLVGEGDWQFKVALSSSTGEWLGYLDQFTLTTTSTTDIVTVDLQDGVGGYAGTTDCYISDWEDGDTTRAFGALEPDTLRLRKVDRMEILMRLELDDVPANASIQHAILGLYAFFNTNPSSPTIYAYQMLRPWAEDSATWLSPLPGQTWGAPGAFGEGTDRVATSMYTHLGDIEPGWIMFDVTAAIQAWANGEPNYGLLLRSWDAFWASSAENSLRASEWHEPELRPRLIVYYAQEDTPPTATPTLPPTATRTPTALPTATRTAMPGGAGQVTGSVAYQGRGSAPASAWEGPLYVTAHLPGDSVPAYTFKVNSDQNGSFEVPSGILPGTYDVGVRNAHSLRNLQQGVAISDHTLALAMGELREGDTNLDNEIDIYDFAILANAFGATSIDAGFDARADLNDDDEIDIYDFALLAANFGQTGDAPAAALLTSARAPQAVRPDQTTVEIRVEPATTQVGVGQTTQVDVYAYTSEEQVAGIECTISYDPSYLQISITPGSALGTVFQSTVGATSVVYKAGAPGPLYTPVSGRIHLFRLTLTGQLATASTLLDITTVKVSDPLGNPLPWDAFDGTVAVTGDATATPTQTTAPTHTSTPTTGVAATHTATPIGVNTATRTQTPTRTYTPAGASTPTRTAMPVASATATSPTDSIEQLVQQGVAGFDGFADTYLDSWDQLHNYDVNLVENQQLKLRSADVKRILLRADLTSLQIPQTAIVEQASLTLYSLATGHEIDAAVYGVERAWDVRAASWLSATQSLRWDTPGCNQILTDRAEASTYECELLPAVDDDDSHPYSFAITELMQHWIAHPEQNQGLLIVSEDPTGTEYRFRSSQSQDVPMRPLLSIRYHLAPTATPTLTPTATLTATASPTATASATASATPSATATATATPSPSVTITETVTLTPTPSATPTPERSLVQLPLILS